MIKTGGTRGYSPSDKRRPDKAKLAQMQVRNASMAAAIMAVTESANGRPQDQATK